MARKARRAMDGHFLAGDEAIGGTSANLWQKPEVEPGAVPESPDHYAGDGDVHLAVQIPERVGGKLRLGRTACGRSAGFWLRFAESRGLVTCKKCLAKLKSAQL